MRGSRHRTRKPLPPIYFVVTTPFRFGRYEVLLLMDETSVVVMKTWSWDRAYNFADRMNAFVFDSRRRRW